MDTLVESKATLKTPAYAAKAGQGRTWRPGRSNGASLARTTC